MPCECPVLRGGGLRRTSRIEPAAGQSLPGHSCRRGCPVPGGRWRSRWPSAVVPGWRPVRGGFGVVCAVMLAFSTTESSCFGEDPLHVSRRFELSPPCQGATPQRSASFTKVLPTGDPVTLNVGTTQSGLQGGPGAAGALPPRRCTSEGSPTAIRCLLPRDHAPCIDRLGEGRSEEPVGALRATLPGYSRNVHLHFHSRSPRSPSPVTWRA